VRYRRACVKNQLLSRAPGLSTKEAMLKTCPKKKTASCTNTGGSKRPCAGF